MKKISFALLVILLFCAFSQKDYKLQTELLLIDGDWVHTEYLTDANNDGIFENAALPCQIGDVWRFTADHKFQWRDEIEYCDMEVDSLAITHGTWELRNNDTELYIEIDPVFLSYNFHIHIINSNFMELRQYNDPSTFAPPEERLRFVK